ncbi:hypothetical protein ACFXPR_08535 [Nocardia tengchongensis]|uniref:hypothetical protein n=1 Tax=Nocardia tengchongensis TaxID=2055889 RepID=UPI00367C6962
MPADDIQAAIEQFATELAELRMLSGKPSFARIQNLSKKRHQEDGTTTKAISLPSTTASDAIRGKRLPSIATVLAFVDACHRAAVDDGLIIDEDHFALARWQQRWTAVRDLRDRDFSPPEQTLVEWDDLAEDEQLAAPDSIPPSTNNYRDAASSPDPSPPPRPSTSAQARIERAAERYADQFDYIRREPRRDRRRHEYDLLDKLQEVVSLATEYEQYEERGRRRLRNRLTFADIYFEADSVTRVNFVSATQPFTVVPVEYFAALIAAEIEYHGTGRLSDTEYVLLADVYERIGGWMLELGLFIHAVFVYKRAAVIHYRNEDLVAQERCELAGARARRRAMVPSFKSISMQATDLLCGYGYLPFRMLGWMLAQLVVFTVIFQFLTYQPLAITAVDTFTNYFSPLSPADTQNFQAAARPLFLVESAIGSLMTLSFAVLLARRFLRLGR